MCVVLDTAHMDCKIYAKILCCKSLLNTLLKNCYGFIPLLELHLLQLETISLRLIPAKNLS